MHIAFLDGVSVCRHILFHLLIENAHGKSAADVCDCSHHWVNHYSLVVDTCSAEILAADFGHLISIIHNLQYTGLGEVFKPGHGKHLWQVLGSRSCSLFNTYAFCHILQFDGKYRAADFLVRVLVHNKVNELAFRTDMGPGLIPFDNTAGPAFFVGSHGDILTAALVRELKGTG